jgi:D-galactarolactone isomerase
VAAGGLALKESRAEEHRIPFPSGTAAPQLKAPANACDCHMHFYDDRFPVAPAAAAFRLRKSAISS